MTATVLRIHTWWERHIGTVGHSTETNKSGPATDTPDESPVFPGMPGSVAMVQAPGLITLGQHTQFEMPIEQPLPIGAEVVLGAMALGDSIPDGVPFATCEEAKKYERADDGTIVRELKGIVDRVLFDPITHQTACLLVPETESSAWEHTRIILERLGGHIPYSHQPIHPLAGHQHIPQMHPQVQLPPTIGHAPPPTVGHIQIAHAPPPAIGHIQTVRPKPKGAFPASLVNSAWSRPPWVGRDKYNAASEQHAANLEQVLVRIGFECTAKWSDPKHFDQDDPTNGTS